MVINKKALLAAMQAEYKTCGYIVARRYDETDDEDTLVIQGASWLAEISWQNAPGEVLARIAGDLKDLPSRGQAFQAKKGAPNTTIFEMVDKMPDAKTPPRILAHRTHLQYGSMEVWQKNGNNGVIFVPLDKAQMLLDHGREVVWAESGLFLEGEASRVFVCQFVTSRTDSPETEAINYLSGKAWC